MSEPLEWYDVDQHPDSGCCQSCIEDIEYDVLYRVGDFRCCCRSEVEDDTEAGVIAFAAIKGDQP